MYGASYATRWLIGTPRLAASSANAAPEEIPTTIGRPPASRQTAARSSTSLSTLYGFVSVLPPRPRRSYENARKYFANSAANLRRYENSLNPNAPATSTRGGPVPDTSNAMRVPSPDATGPLVGDVVVGFIPASAEAF